MWKIKKFYSREEMVAWLADREGRIQYQELFINNGLAVEWRPLRIVH